MQVKFTIELKVSFEDKRKIPLLKDAVRDEARNLYAIAALLAENRKPEIVIYGDDFFDGKVAITLEDPSA